jgi:hypothetical protein
MPLKNSDHPRPDEHSRLIDRDAARGVVPTIGRVPAAVAIRAAEQRAEAFAGDRPEILETLAAPRTRHQLFVAGLSASFARTYPSAGGVRRAQPQRSEKLCTQKARCCCVRRAGAARPHIDAKAAKVSLDGSRRCVAVA